MKRSFALLMLLALLIVSALPGFAQDDDYTAEIDDARGILTMLNAGEYSAVFARFSPDVAAALPEAQLEAVWNDLLAGSGAYVAELNAEATTSPAGVSVILTTQYEAGALDIIITIAETGEITGLFIRPAENLANDLPDYADPAVYTEIDVVVGEDTDFPVPGLLTIPAGNGPFPVIIMMSGSGPNDMDSTIGPNRPFRDIAVGLATEGIATLRYDKRTRVHTAAAVEPGNGTVVFEYIADALNAIDLVQEVDQLDRERIFVLGHSLGGTVAPRLVREAEADIAGVILMAAGAVPLHEAVARQVTYLSELDGTVEPAEQAQIDAIAVEVDRINAGLDADNTTPTLLGLPVEYMLDLLANPAVDIAIDLSQPMLILQGERDYQITVADDLPLWEAAIGGRENVEIVVFPLLNHLMMVGEGAPNPDEYGMAGFVDVAVIATIAEWVQTQ